MAGPLAAATASTVTNPMDVVRARVQVNCTSIRESCDDLGLLNDTKTNSFQIKHVLIFEILPVV